MRSFLRSLYEIHSMIFTAALAFVAVVETAHMRYYLKHGPKNRIVFTAIAAGVALYIASETLEQEWPTWNGHGYDD